MSLESLKLKSLESLKLMSLLALRLRALTERRQITVHRVKIPQACVRNSRLQYQVTLHISGL